MRPSQQSQVLNKLNFHNQTTSVVGDFRTFEKISLVVVMNSVNLWKPRKLVVGGATYRFDAKVAVCDFRGKIPKP